MMEDHMKKLDDPLELQKYVTGQKGKTMRVAFDPEDGPQFRTEDIEVLSKLYGNMSL